MYLASGIEGGLFDPVPYQLLCQSLELHLKSFIWVKEKYGRNKIRNKYGHDINKLWRHCKERRISKYVNVTPLREKVISLVGPYYKDRKFCYLDLDMMYDGYPEINSEPKVLQSLRRLTLQLGKTLHRPVYDASQPV